MKPASLSFLLILIISFACSNKAERDRALQDLERKQHKLQQYNNVIVQLKSDLNNSVLELEVAKDDLQQVKQFKLMRTESEREQQIKNATQRILDIQTYIDHVSSSILIVGDSVLYNEGEITRLKELIKG